MLRILFFLLLPYILLAQSSNWNSIVDLNLSVNSTDRTDLYTDRDGNHILVENGSTLKYYLYSSDGDSVRSYTIDGSISSTYSKITGWKDTLYISYLEGSTIYSKYSTDTGSSWSNLSNITLGTSDSDGLELWTDSDGLHIVYSEWDGNNSVYETKYKLSEHNSTSWGNAKTVTDEGGVSGGRPSVSTSSGRIHVGFGNDLVKTRDKSSTTWQSSQEIEDIAPQRISVFATSGKLHSFYGKTVGGLSLNLNYKNRSLTGSTWSTETTLAQSHGQSEYNKLDVTVTDNDKLHVVYSGSVKS